MSTWRAFLTPLCKYYATELSNVVARRGVQVHGGLGYMAESRAGQYLSDSIITTIYEGTSEIQASFALKEMSKGALFAALDAVSTAIDLRRDAHAPLVDQVHQGIDWIHKSLSAVMGDPRYALLNAKRLCDMVIDVLVASRAAGPGAALRGEARARHELHPPADAGGRDQRAPHRRWRRVAHPALRHDSRAGCSVRRNTNPLPPPRMPIQ
jgi:hypothetical protein